MKNVLLGFVACGLLVLAAGVSQAAEPHQPGFDLQQFASGIQLDKAQPIQLAHGGGWGGGYPGGGWGGYPGGGWGGGYPGGYGCYRPPVCRHPYPYPYGGGGGFSLYGPRGGFSIRY